MLKRLSKVLAQLWDSLRWHYGTVLNGRKARRHRFLRIVQLRVCGEWTNAHSSWREQFKPL